MFAHRRHQAALCNDQQFGTSRWQLTDKATLIAGAPETGWRQVLAHCDGSRHCNMMPAIDEEADCGRISPEGSPIHF
jgi:hypothetical protein